MWFKNRRAKYRKHGNKKSSAIKASDSQTSCSAEEAEDWRKESQHKPGSALPVPPSIIYSSSNPSLHSTSTSSTFLPLWHNSYVANSPSLQKQEIVTPKPLSYCKNHWQPNNFTQLPAQCTMHKYASFALHDPLQSTPSLQAVRDINHTAPLPSSFDLLQRSNRLLYDVWPNGGLAFSPYWFVATKENYSIYYMKERLRHAF